jgi:amino acid adenylation domain-containing protein/non-ribosomal peptide synthase protein (TIGR01720 family)
MNLVEFYLDLAAQGITLWAEDGKLRYRAPKEAMTPAIVETIKEQRSEILGWLQERTATVGPLSAAQRGLWYVYQSAPQSPAYNLMFTMQLNPQVDGERFGRAWAWLVERHPILRTTYAMQGRGQDERLVAQVRDDLPVAVASLDVSAWSEAQVSQWIEVEADRPFDLAQGPIWRGHLLTGEAASYFVLVVHHIAFDFVAVQQLFQELAAVYASLQAGEAPSLEPLAAGFGDYVRWEQDKLAEEETQLAGYWQEQLSGSLPVIELPTDHVRPPVQSYRGAIHEFEVDAGLSEALRGLAQRNGVTPYMLVLAAYQTLLHRYSGQDDILIGTPMDMRGLAAFREVIGYYINSVVLRADLSGDPTFEELLGRVRTTALGALKHQRYPFARLVEQLHLPRDPSRSPVFQVSFVWDRFAVDADQSQEKDRLIQKALTAGQRGASDDLGLSFYDLGQTSQATGRGFGGSLTYNRDLFEASTIERMAQQFQTLLAAIVQNPHQRLSELSLLNPAERHQLLVEWNDTAADYPLDRSYHELFAEQVARGPERVAVVTADGTRLTYEQLDQQANQLAHYLRGLGVGPNDLVGIALERSLEMVVGVLGILKAGGAYLPLDPNYPSERLRFMLDDAQPPVVLVKRQQKASLAGLGLDNTRVVDMESEWPVISQELSTAPQIAVAPDNLAYVIYTSGSTGKPKGVMIPQRGLVNLCYAAIKVYEIAGDDRVLQFSTLNFDIAVEEIFPALLVGAWLVLRGPEAVIAVDALHQLAEREQVTIFDLPTAYWHEWVAEMVRRDMALPPSLRAVIVGGEKASSPHFALWQEKAGSALAFFNGYGPTETSVTATVFRAGEAALSSGGELPIGRPLANARVYILDRAMQPTPIGVPGELYIGGAGVALGYLKRPELTDERFVPDPFSQTAGARLYRTGDRVRYRPDGQIEFIGRADDQVKIRGFRVELGEIEAILTLHPQVDEAAVILQEVSESSRRLAAFVVAPEALDLNDLRGWLGERLPAYMVPAGLAVLPGLPHLPNGKIDRAALVALDRIQSSSETSTPTPEAEESLTDTETSLRTIWSDVLNLDEADIHLHDNFFELGGDSILSIQIVSRALEAGITVTPEQLFQNQTIADLARIANTTARQIAEQGLVTGRLPLTPIHHWFFEQNLAQPHHYNVALLFDVQPSVDEDHLQAALAALLAHHDGLRLRFVQERGSRWEAINAPLDQTTPLEIVDICHLPPEQQRVEIERTAGAAQASLNITEGPLIRVLLFKRSPGAVQMLIVVHHLAIDGLSWRVLLEDLETAYTQHSQNLPLRLPAKTTAFKEWAERLAADGPQAVERERAYWLGLADAEPLVLPVDSTGGENSIGSAATLRVSLTPAQTRALLSEAPSAYRVQINDLLLTALAQTLAEWTGQNELLLHLEGHGREEVLDGINLSRTVGWFTTIYPVKFVLDEAKSASSNGSSADSGYATGLDETIKSIKESLRQVPNNGIGYGILRYLAETAVNPASNANQQGGRPVPTLADIPPAVVSFNYLGQFRYGTADSALLLGLADEPIGSPHAPENPRSHLLEVDALIEEGTLRILWSYSQNRHAKATIEKLAARYVEHLDRLVAHCLSAQDKGYTPSDFAGARVNQSQLDKLMSRIKKD